MDLLFSLSTVSFLLLGQSLLLLLALIISTKTVFISSEVRIVGLGDADQLTVLQGCPGIPGAPGPKGEPGLPGTKGEAPKAVFPCRRNGSPGTPQESRTT
uniref:Uncharacterized protein n=1 Tax=Otus sunia TaxID=257818 RepID=A0A8C8EAK8_9STRI